MLNIDELHKLIGYSCINLKHASTVEKEFSHFKEEMAELILALERKNRERATDEDILEETVDVFMFCIQMGLCHYGSEKFNKMLAKKNDKFLSAILKNLTK